jgi:serine/threonine-protein kinase
MLFTDEMRLARLLRHPNIVELIEADIIDNQPYLILEYIDGPSLRDIVIDARQRGVFMSPRLAASLAFGVCAGLHYAHELKSEWGAPLQLVHRDVSPQNIMVSRSGKAKILDFGVARAVGQRHRTAEKGLKGKLSYTPPEYILGTKPDRRGDIFALGVVLWEMVTSQRLFYRASVPATMHAVLDEPIPSPSQHNPSVFPELETTILTALSRDPEERWLTAQRMSDAIARALEPYGGVMSGGEVAATVASEFPTLVTHDQLDPSMSDSELSHFATATAWPPDSAQECDAKPQESLHSFEVDLEGIDDPNLEWTTEVDLVPPVMEGPDKKGK